ncbi:Sigma54-dependent transcriptional activator SfnR [Paraburkholderia aspalathi]|uniref:Sigma54-dependent transcriptional activator SfnR n=2 Tax=Paraburkholderia aspalathi TaxID=1324617 RepID=A0ABN7MH00_9BURK|nr:Sigma54-dependent transcriptional activator SfnR [Paraburkholderia aspalathi]
MSDMTKQHRALSQCLQASTRILSLKLIGLAVEPVASTPLEGLEGALRHLFDHAEGNLFEQIEDTVMRVAFDFCYRNQIQAARLLGISRNVLRARLIRAKQISAQK